MKFIRDIIAEKKRGTPVVDGDTGETKGILSDSGEFGPESSLKGVAPVPPLHEVHKGVDIASRADESAESEPEAQRDALQADIDEPATDHASYNGFSTADSFHLNGEKTGVDRRQSLIDALDDDSADEQDESGFMPDEPQDLKINGEAAQDIDENEEADVPVEISETLVAEEETPQEEMEAEAAAEPSEADSNDLDAVDEPDEVAEPETASAPEQSIEALIKEEISEAAPPAASENMQDPEPAEQAPEAEAFAVEPAQPEPAAETPVSIPKPTAGRAMGTSGRVKTRLLGFSGPGSAGADPFAKKEEQSVAPAYSSFPVGWLVVIDGPGRGAAFSIFNGVSQIGRGTGQTVRLDFGDNSISRENHAAIAYDAEQRKFYLGHGGKANLVRLNNRPVLSTEELVTDNQIRIGETILRFVALCGEEFCWEQGEKNGVQNVACG